MKSFLTITLFLLAMLSMGLVTAQTKLTEEQKKELQAKYESYKAELNLTEEQQEKVKQINSAYFERIAEIKGSGDSRLSKLRTFRKLSDKKDTQMKDVLDKNQYKIYTKMQKEMKKELKSKRSGG